MGLSVLMAQILGVTYLVVGLGLIFNVGYYQKAYREIAKDSAVFFLSGILALVIGTVLAIHHNLWIASWEVIITVFAWLAFLKGVLILLLPTQMMSVTDAWMKSKSLITIAGVFSIVIGLVLGYFGFFV